MIYPTNRINNRLFAVSFRNSAIGSMGCSFVKCYIRLVEIKDFDALIDNKQFFDQPIKKARSIWKTYRNVNK